MAVLASNSAGTSKSKKGLIACKRSETEAVLVSAEIELISVLFKSCVNPPPGSVHYAEMSLQTSMEPCRLSGRVRRPKSFALRTWRWHLRDFLALFRGAVGVCGVKPALQAGREILLAPAAAQVG